MAGDDSIALGELLHEARLRRGLTLDQISRETKIPARYLAALERGELKQLPGGTYTRGEVIAFATAVGVDRNVALDRLNRALHPPQADHATAVSAPTLGSRTSSAARLPIIVVLGAVAIAVGVSTSRGRSVDESTSLTEQGEQAPSEPLPREPTTPKPTAAPPVSRASQSEAAATEPTSPPAAAALEEVVRPSEALRSERSLGTAAPQPQMPAALVIVTEPPGARVTIDGIGWGVTPLTIRNLPPGKKQIRITSSGYSAVQRTVQMPERGTAKVVIPLRAQ